MNLFSISQLAQFSGIKPHTIRVWEKRYNALQPDRSEGNTRYYNGEQLRRLLNIVSLQNEQLKLPELCRLSDRQLFRLIEQKQQATRIDTHDHYVNQLIAAGMCFDESAFDKTISHCFMRFGVVQSYQKVIYPALHRIGIMWAGNSIPPAQEHFISNMIRQKLAFATDTLPLPTLTSERWMLFLPEDEFHETGLLLANYLLRQSGRKVTYLGSSLPISTLKNASTLITPTHLLLFFVKRNLKENIQVYLNELHSVCNNGQIIICGQPEHFNGIKLKKNMTLITDLSALETKLGIKPV